MCEWTRFVSELLLRWRIVNYQSDIFRHSTLMGREGTNSKIFPLFRLYCQFLLQIKCFSPFIYCCDSNWTFTTIEDFFNWTMKENYWMTLKYFWMDVTHFMYSGGGLDISKLRFYLLSKVLFFPNRNKCFLTIVQRIPWEIRDMTKSYLSYLGDG